MTIWNNNRNTRQHPGFMKTTLLALSLACLFQSLLAQPKDSSSVYLIGRPLKDSIMLRWAPADHGTWQLGNRHGYYLARYTVMQDSSMVPDIPSTLQLFGPFKPLELEDWEPLVKADKYAAIAAQALYGESFNVDAGEGFSPGQVMYKSREQRQRFSISLYAADMSPGVSRAAGLRYVDHTVSNNEMYLYRLYLALPDSLQHLVDTAILYTGYKDFQPLPPPVEVKTRSGDRVAIISWNAFAQDNIYQAWEVSRSDNGGRTYQMATIDPLVPLKKGEGFGPGTAYKYDSLPENNKDFYYRVRGISSFGERGPWSDPVTGRGITAMKGNPNITGHEVDKNKVTLSWDFPGEQQKNISGFRVYRANNDKTGFALVSKDLKPGTREFTDKEPLGTGYYKVKSFRDTVEGKSSYPYMVQLTDDTPPEIPAGLKGKADTSGIVKITWQANTETDLYGYRVFRSVSGKDEYSQLTSKPIFINAFVDTLNKQDLNASVYYKILAVDNRQNESRFSRVLEISKPDIIPPSMPVIDQVKATNEGIEINWTNSTSQDVAKHEVWRHAGNDTAWIMLNEFPAKRNQETGAYIDVDCHTSKPNKYKVLAYDQAGNVTSSFESIALTGLVTRYSKGTVKLKKIVDQENGLVQLSWQKPAREVKLVHVYHQNSDKPYHLYQTLDGKNQQFTDKGLKAGKTYAYRIKWIYSDGSISGFSNEIKIEF